MKDKDGLGERERMGVDVEKVANASEINVSRLFEGMAQYSSEDLEIVRVQPVNFRPEKKDHLDAADNPLSAQ